MKMTNIICLIFIVLLVAQSQRLPDYRDYERSKENSSELSSWDVSDMEEVAEFGEELGENIEDLIGGKETLSKFMEKFTQQFEDEFLDSENSESQNYYDYYYGDGANQTNNDSDVNGNSDWNLEEDVIGGKRVLQGEDILEELEDEAEKFLEEVEENSTVQEVFEQLDNLGVSDVEEQIGQIGEEIIDGLDEIESEAEEFVEELLEIGEEELEKLGQFFKIFDDLDSWGGSWVGDYFYDQYDNLQDYNYFEDTNGQGYYVDSNGDFYTKEFFENGFYDGYSGEQENQPWDLDQSYDSTYVGQNISNMTQYENKINQGYITDDYDEHYDEYTGKHHGQVHSRQNRTHHSSNGNKPWSSPRNSTDNMNDEKRPFVEFNQDFIDRYNSSLTQFDNYQKDHELYDDESLINAKRCVRQCRFQHNCQKGTECHKQLAVAKNNLASKFEACQSLKNRKQQKMEDATKNMQICHEALASEMPENSKAQKYYFCTMECTKSIFV